MMMFSGTDLKKPFASIYRRGNESREAVLLLGISRRYPEFEFNNLCVLAL